MPAWRPPNPYTCTTHADSPAAWRCLGCERQLCEACAAPTEARSTSTPLTCCAHCGGGTVPLTVPGVEHSFRQLLTLTLVLPIGLRTLGVLVALWVSSGLLATTAHAGGPAWGVLVLATSLMLALFTVLLLRAAALGMDGQGLETGDASTPLVAPALRLWPLCAFLLAVPHLSEYAPAWRTGPSLTDLLIFTGAGLAGPLVTLGLVLGRPVDLARRLPRLGTDAWLTAGLTGLATLLCWHFLAGAAYIETRDPQLSFFAVILHAAALLILLWMARLHGTVLHVHAPALGHPLPARFQVPVAPEAQPRAAPYQPPAPPPKVVKPLELDLEAEPPALEALVRALEARDAAGALAAFARLDASQRALLSPDTYVQLGKAAASRGEWSLAREALTLGTRVQPQHPTTATACVLLARLLAERFGEPATADAFYRHVVTHYPHTEAAAFARSRLGSTA